MSIAVEIKFDPEAYKTAAIAGPYESRDVIEQACSKRDPQDPTYRLWAAQYGVNPDSGSIITTAYNPDLLSNRYKTLELQLKDFIGAKLGLPPSSGLNCKIAPHLRAALEEVAKERSQQASPERLKGLMISTLRENPVFDLLKDFPQLNLRVHREAATEEDANRSNHLIQTMALELSDTFVYKSDWQGQAYDFVAVDPAILYLDEEGVKNLMQNISDSGARRVIFSNIMCNTDPNGAAQWKTQRYGGGIIPLRIPARGELTALAQKFNYTCDNDSQAAHSFDLRQSSFATQNPVLDNFSFIRHSLP